MHDGDEGEPVRIASNSSAEFYFVNGRPRAWRDGLTLADVVAAEAINVPAEDLMDAAISVVASELETSIITATPASGADTSIVMTMPASGAVAAAATTAPPLLEPEARASCMASSVNGCFVARTNRPSTCIAPRDQILLLQPIVGG